MANLLERHIFGCRMDQHNSTQMVICFLESIFEIDFPKLLTPRKIESPKKLISRNHSYFKRKVTENVDSKKDRSDRKIPLFLYKLLHSQVYPPGVLVHTALRSQLWVPIKHSLISSHSVPGNCKFKSMKPGRHVQKNPPLWLVQVALRWQLWSPVPHLSMPTQNCWRMLVTENCWRQKLTWLEKFLKMFQKI